MSSDKPSLTTRWVCTNLLLYLKGYIIVKTVSVVQTPQQQVQGRQVVTPKGSQVGSAMAGQSRQIPVQTGNYCKSNDICATIGFESTTETIFAAASYNKEDRKDKVQIIIEFWNFLHRLMHSKVSKYTRQKMFLLQHHHVLVTFRFKNVRKFTSSFISVD